MYEALVNVIAIVGTYVFSWPIDMYRKLHYRSGIKTAEQ